MPEKNLAEIPRNLRELYAKGKAAFERNNLDYAITILTGVLAQEPAFYEAREALRATQCKRGKKSGLFKRLLSSAHPKYVQAQAVWRKNPTEAVRLLEEVLNQDPFNAAAHRLLAEAAMAADLPKTAVLSLEIVRKNNPDDRETAVKLARALGKLGQWARAESLLAAMVNKRPDDLELADELKEVAAKRTLEEGGYDKLADGQGSYRDILKDEKEATLLEQEQRSHKDEDAASRLLAEYESRLREEPNNLRLLRSVAELYAERKEFDKALAYYNRLQQMEARDPSLERAVAALYAKRFEEELAQLDPNAPDYAARKEAILKQKQEFLLADARRRVERYPNDPHLRFELGQLLYEAGQTREAIEQFQKAQASPSLRIRSLYHLSLCFMRRGMHDLAARSLQNALKEKTEMDGEKKELLYTLGLAYEKMGRREEALEQFKLIYETDIAFRDVAERVDAYYAAQENPPGEEGQA